MLPTSYVKNSSQCGVALSVTWRETIVQQNNANIPSYFQFVLKSQTPHPDQQQIKTNIHYSQIHCEF